MAGIDKGTGRVAVVIALLVFAAAALRGYLPDGQGASREQPTDSPASVFAVVALLGVSVVIIVIAKIASLRDPRTTAVTAGGLPGALGGKRLRLKRRFLLIGLGVILAWLLIVILLARLDLRHSVDPLAAVPGPSTAAPTAPPTPPPSAAPPEADGIAFGFFVGASAVLLVLFAMATAVASRRRRRVDPYLAADDTFAPVSSAPGSGSLALAAELGLAEIGDLSREPRDAIIACYAAMEEGLANAPGAVPQDSDTPSEVLARAVEHGALRADSATELVDLFAEARFSPHVMSEGHREVAVRVLRLVLAELRSVT
jgi:hypothetical protein